MKTSPPAARPGRELLLAHLADELDVAGAAELSASLENDPAFRREAVIIVLQELQLRQLAQRRASVRALQPQPAVAWLAKAFLAVLNLGQAARRRPMLHGAFGAGAAAVLLFLWVQWQAGWLSRVRVQSLTGQATVSQQAQVRPAKPGLGLQPGDHVRLAPDSVLVLAYRGETTVVRFWDAAQFTVGAPAPGKTLALHQGALSAAVSRQAPSAPMRITTPHAQATVLGTEFSLAVDTLRSRLDVWDGAVRLSGGAAAVSFEVGAGDFAFATDLGPLQHGPMRQGVRRECWLGEADPGDRPLADLSCLTRQPSLAEDLPNLAAPQNWNDAFLSRLTARVRPRVSGLYEFWVSGDDRAELWLSPDDHPEHKSRICWTSRWTAPGDWDQSPSQKSAPVRLEAGRQYYIEALHYDRGGADFVSVAWRPPQAPRQLIPGRYLTADALDPAAPGNDLLHPSSPRRE